MNIKLYILGANNDDKGSQLEELTTSILKDKGIETSQLTQFIAVVAK